MLFINMHIEISSAPGGCSYLPFLCSALAFEIHVLFSIDRESKASKAFYKHPSQSLIKMHDHCGSFAEV